VSQTRQQREAIATLIAYVESDDDQGLKGFLVDDSRVLCDALYVTTEELTSLGAMAPAPRRVRLQSILRLAKERDHAVAVRSTQSLAVAAAIQLAGLARWREDYIELEPAIVLGRGIRGDCSRKFIEFVAEAFKPVAVRREKLEDAASGLRHLAVTCRLESRGLCFYWREGKGHLYLVSQTTASASGDAVLRVTFTRPPTPKVENRLRPVSVLPSFSEVFAQIMQM